MILHDENAFTHVTALNGCPCLELLLRVHAEVESPVDAIGVGWCWGYRPIPSSSKVVLVHRSCKSSGTRDGSGACMFDKIEQKLVWPCEFKVGKDVTRNCDIGSVPINIQLASRFVAEERPIEERRK